MFSAKQKFENFIRLNCGNPWSPVIENAIRKLGQLLASTSSSTNGVSKHSAVLTTARVE
jgi:DNA-binding transcriptional MocR family regulator